MNTKNLLDDRSYLQFLTDGFITVQPELLEAKDHDFFYKRAQDLYDRTAALRSPTAHLEILGDNLRAQIPEIDLVLQDPAVVGAITSVLGEDYVIHPHNFVHKSNRADQCFHQDGNLPWNERGHYRSHRPDWLILFYYPQEVNEGNGPTEIVPGSQYWTRDIEKGRDDWYPDDSLDRSFGKEVQISEDLEYRDQRLQQVLDDFAVPDLQRKFVHVAKGSVLIGNYDLIHRGSRKLPDVPNRFMYKFYFARTKEPKRAAWSNQTAIPSLNKTRKEIQPVVEDIWRWSSGKQHQESVLDLVKAEKDLFDGREDQQVAAAYRLGRTATDAAIDVLDKGINNENESTRRASSYGLRSAGSAGTKILISACGADLPSTRRFGVFGLGNIATAQNPDATNTLLTCLKDNDDLVRSNAAYSLGQVSRGDFDQANEIFEVLMARLQPGTEPNNTDAALLPRSTVRQSIAYALMQYAFNQPLSEWQISEMVNIAIKDDDRYVRGMLLEALGHASGKMGHVHELIQGLIKQRWSVPPEIASTVS